MDYAAAIAAIAWVLYHYLTNRDIRNTLHEIRDSLDHIIAASTAQPGSQEPHITTSDQEQDQPPS